MNGRYILKKNIKQNGFTFVEIAIVMIIIGLLVGGVLGGMVMIENGRNNATIQFMKNVESVAVNFRTAYGKLPGDLDVIDVLPNCTALPCTKTGNGNGQVWGGGADSGWSVMYEAWGDLDSNNEEFVFWQHLLAAGMMSGYLATTNMNFGTINNGGQPLSPMDTGFRIAYANAPAFGGAKHVGYLTDSPSTANIWDGGPTTTVVPSSNMRSIDLKIDDGFVNKGKIGARTRNSSTTPCFLPNFRPNMQMNEAAVEYANGGLCNGYMVYNF